MSALGFALKVVAVVVGLVGCMLAGEQALNPADDLGTVIAVLFVIAVLAGVGGYWWHEAPDVRRAIRWARSGGVRDFVPEVGEGWLAQEVWRECPDPLPEVPAESKALVWRRKGLVAEERRLMALDAERPGGPIGGESVTLLRPKPEFDGPSYCPPEVPGGAFSPKGSDPAGS